MTAQEALAEIFVHLPESRQDELLEFAQYLSWREQREAWRDFGREQFAKAYGPDEPLYSADDLLPESQS
jgi:hypothetical protein